MLEKTIDETGKCVLLSFQLLSTSTIFTQTRIITYTICFHSFHRK